MDKTAPDRPMEWLNYHHLLYFWTVVREGGVSRAADKLRLSQPTISAQVRMLEEALGERLLQRQGRTFALTDVGRLVYRYADEIFGAGRELMEALRGRPVGRPVQLTVGVANAVQKLIVYRLLRPATRGARAGSDRLPRGQRRAARRATRDARLRRRHCRCACAAARAREGVQPLAR